MPFTQAQEIMPLNTQNSMALATRTALLLCTEIFPSHATHALPPRRMDTSKRCAEMDSPCSAGISREQAKRPLRQGDVAGRERCPVAGSTTATRRIQDRGRAEAASFPTTAASVLVRARAIQPKTMTYAAPPAFSAFCVLTATQPLGSKRKHNNAIH